MAANSRCPQCGAEVPDDAAEGLCPRCLLARAVHLANPRTAAAIATWSLAATSPPDIPRYRILQLLGAGGMGAVYQAEQLQPHRTVALKVIKPGLASAEMLRRFSHEGEVLGRLQHSGIAQIFEAGTADSGLGPQPFFAMELVRGTAGEKAPSLIDYADRKKLDARHRLELLAKVADAVHYAHQKGIIHRDLKPANILIDESGQPKILDFGVARVTDADLKAVTLQTDIGQIIGTLPYMSPEQAGGDPTQLDTRSDVYSLGVIGYELLSGRLPHELKTLMIHEAVRVIRQDEPSRLSSISKIFRGDIETIVAKALAKEKERRYQSAAELAADARRYLADEPINARPPSARYQIGKFAKRNKAIVVGIAAANLLLIAGTIATSLQAIRARRAESRALIEEREAKDQAAIVEAVSQFQSDMLSSADPEKLLGDKVTVLQALRGAIKQLDAGKLANQPLVEAALRRAIGNTLSSIGRFDDAALHLRRALRIYRKVLPAGQGHIAHALFDLGHVLFIQGHLDEAEAMFREALSIHRKIGTQTSIAANLSNLAMVLHYEGKLIEAEALYRETLDTSRKILPADENLAADLSNFADLLKAEGKYSEAEQLDREAVAIYRKALPPAHPRLASGLSSLGVILRVQGKLSEAEPLLREAVGIRRKALPAGHPDLAPALGYLALLLMDEKKFNEAEPLAREALETDRKALPAGHPDIATCLGYLGRVLLAQGKFTEAELNFREELSIDRHAYPADHPNIATDLTRLGVVLDEQRKLTEAEPIFREALAIARKALPAGHPEIANDLYNVAAVLFEQDRFAEAEPLVRESLEIQRKTLVAGHPALANSSWILGFVLAYQERFAEAEPLMREALAIRLRTLGPKAEPTTQTVRGLAELLIKTNRLEEAAALRKEYGFPDPATRPSTYPSTQPQPLPSTRPERAVTFATRSCTEG